MPIFEEAPEITAPIPDKIAAWKPGLQTAVIDSRYIPQSDLLAYIEGSTWVVDYYSQVLDVHNELHGHDSSLPAPLQQYKRIWSMELKVVQDLQNVSQDQSSKEFTLQGSANVYPFLVPQVGDMFRAGIADGREGLFKVTNVEARQIFADRAHVIEYQLIAANDPVRLFDLNEKVQVTYYFVKDFLLNLQNPLLVEEDYNASKELEHYWYDLIHIYFKMYFSREYMTLVVPGQAQPTYDHGLTSFVKDIMDSFDDVHIQAIRQLNIGDDGAMNSPSLWTMLLRRDPKLFKFVYKKTGLVPRQSFHRSGLMAGMRYTGISQIVYPIDFKRTVDYVYGGEEEKTISSINIVSTMLTKPPIVAPGSPIAPMLKIKSINMEDGYVLSSAFYERKEGLYSLMERLVHDYLEFKLIAAKDVLSLCTDSYNWGHVERFYYLPIVLMLIKYNLRRL